MYTGLKYSRPALRPDAINLDVPVKNVHIDSVDGGASRGTRCVAWLSSPSFSDGETSDDVSDGVGLTSVACVSNDRHVTGPRDDVTAAAGDDDSDSNSRQVCRIMVNENKCKAPMTTYHPNYGTKVTSLACIKTSDSDVLSHTRHFTNFYCCYKR